MVYSVSIIGGQCSRYIFENDIRNYFKIKTYLEDIITLVRPVHNTELDQKIYADLDLNNWKHLQIKEDLSECQIQRINEKKTDYLIIDFTNIIKGFYFDKNNNNIYAPFDFYRNYVSDTFEYKKINKEFFDNNIESFVEFVKKIKNSYKNNEIILIKTKIPTYTKNRYGGMSTNNIEEIEEYNKILSKLFITFEKQFENDPVKPYIIDLTEYCIADSDHEYGPSKYNFISKFYEKAINELYNIIDGSGNQINEIKLNKPRYALIINKFDKKNAFKTLGYNTGNNAFWSSIIRLFDPDLIPYDYLSKNIDLNEYEAIIITDLIWIRENQDYSYLNPIIDAAPDKIVFMSVGLQSRSFDENFKLPPSIIEILSKIPEERKIGVRGKYTESILNKHGIMNTQIIGCPSMYYWNNRNLQVNNKKAYPLSPLANFRAFFGNLSKNEMYLLNLFKDNKALFVEQNDTDYENCQTLSGHQEIIQYLKEYSKTYFTNIAWLKGIWNGNFSIGMRFHANVMSLRAGIRSLFIISDSRTREMTEYYKLPSIDISQINDEYTMDQLSELADYTEFNENYSKIFDNFINFLTTNNMEIVCKDVLPFDQQQENEIILTDVDLKTLIDGSTELTYRYKIKGKWQINFISNKYKMTYSKSVEGVPESILNIPFLGNILPLSWICNAKVVVDTVDQKFVNYLKYVKNSYIDMNKKEYFGGSLVYNTKENNHNLIQKEKSLLLYSGGVDATNSLIDLLELKPAIFTIWGTDIFFSKNDTNAWKVVTSENEQKARDFDLEYISCKSEFRLAIDTINRKSWINNAIHSTDNYWHIYQHGIALITHTAPLAYKYNYRQINIASSYSSKNKIECCASLPQIDENIRFSSSFVHHNTFGDSRSDKIMKIIDYSEETGYRFKLRVCWETITGNNCCLCEKCVRTLFTIILLNRDPKDYGFNVSDEMFDEIIKKIKSKELNISQFYIDAAMKYSDTYKFNNKLANFLIEWCISK